MGKTDLEARLLAMAGIGRCWSPSFSPDGRRIAFVSDLSGLPQVWSVDVEGGWPEQVTALQDQVQGVSWSPEGSWLAFSLAPGGGMNTQVYLTQPDGTELRCITEGGKTNNQLGRWSHDGGVLFYGSNSRTPDCIDGYIYDLATAEGRLVIENQGIGGIVDATSDLKWATVYRMAYRGDDNLYLVDLESGHETLLTPHDPPGSFGGGRFSADGKFIYLTSNKDRELSALVRVEITKDGEPGREEVLAERSDAELGGFILSDDTKTALLLWNAVGATEAEFIDLDHGVRTTGPKLEQELILGGDFSSEGRLVALNVTGSNSPIDIWVFDRDSDQAWQLTRSPHPGVDLDSLISPEPVSFQAHDGLTLTGWLYRAGGAEPGPVVINFHGGPEGQERPFFSETYQSLLSQGISVFAPNVRGSSGFGKTFVNLDNGRLRFNAVKDIESCVKFIVDSGVGHPKAIGVMGGSYGGFMVTAALTEYPQLIAAGATICGMVNFATFFANTEPWMAAVSKVEYGDPETDPDLFNELSPIHKIDRVTSPTIVLHGANDTNVPVVEAEQVVESLERRGVPVKYVLFPDEGHGFTRKANRVTSTLEIVRWFVKYLRDPLGAQT